MTEDTQQGAFWQSLKTAVDPAAYRPERRENVVSNRLRSREAPYYVIKQPEQKNYLRLSEADYALWWQMDGTKTVKDLLFYSLRRYRTLPIGRLNRLVDDLRQGHFLRERPTNLYQQVETELKARNPAGRGRRLLDGFLHTEIALDGLDEVFTPLYRQTRGLFTRQAQFVLLAIILIGGVLFGQLVWRERFSLAGESGYGILLLLLANLLVIGVHELAHGLTTKHVGRELNRGGFLLYWGMPAFFVDTRDTWLASRRERMLVSWAGPHSGLILGGLAGLALTAVSRYFPSQETAVWTTFIYQIGFLAYLSVLINLNPLLELDGYFILMDWLDAPDLRERAIAFWRQDLWPRWRAHPAPRDFWHSLAEMEQLFTFFGGLTLLYSAYALAVAAYFWQTRLWPFAVLLWTDYGIWGRAALLGITAVLIIPSVYFLLQFGWSRIRAGLAWLARRDLLARPDVLALLTGLPILAGAPLLLFALSTLPQAGPAVAIANWLLHLAAIAAFIGVARQVPGSRFQWALWALTAAPLGLTLAWVWEKGLLNALGLNLTGAGALAAGIVAAFTVWPRRLNAADRITMAALLLIGVAYAGAIYLWDGTDWLPMGFLLFAVFAGLILMTPLVVNFLRSRFALPWILLVLAILMIPWLHYFPFLHTAVNLLWLYAGTLYLLLGQLAQFHRHEAEETAVGAFDERDRLVDSFNHFMTAMFASYEAVFGGRRLAEIQSQMQALGAIDPDGRIFDIAQRCRQALLLAVDRLDDLAGAPFTRSAGQAAYDSLPWLEAETLARHVLAETDWGSGLAQGFIQARNRRAQLIRGADIFAGFDQEGIRSVLAAGHSWHGRKGVQITAAGDEAERFFLIESGEVGVFHEGVQVGAITGGGYFGTMALLDSGEYMATYRTLTPVRAFVLPRARFDPLLRADTTLAQQVSSGARHRELLKKMPLFSSLSPQQLTMIDARLQRKRAAPGETIVHQGQPRSHLFIVAEGVVEAVYEENGEEKVAGTLGPGEHFGEYALFADTPYSTTYRARHQSELLLLDEPKFDELVAGCERLSHYVEQIGSGRLFATRRRPGPSGVLA